MSQGGQGANEGEQVPTRDEKYGRDIEACRDRVIQILATLQSRKHAISSIRETYARASGQRHLEVFRPTLKKRIRVVIFGVHSPDWMGALAPKAAVWSALDLVGEIVHVNPDQKESCDLIKSDGRQVVIPLMENHARAVPPDIAHLTSEVEIIELLSDKGLFAAYLIERNLALFAPRCFQSLEDVEYPCVLKRTDLNGGQGVELIFDRFELDRKVAEKMALNERIIIQSWIDGCEEYVTHAVAVEGRIVWHQTFRYDLGGDGVIRTGLITGEVNIVRVATPKAFLRLLSRISTDLGISGPVNVDYKIVDEKPVLFEINPRLGGSLMRPDNIDLLAMALAAVVEGAVATDPFFAGIIRGSRLFNADFYSSAENDFEPMPQDMALHYFRQGAREGRDPSHRFSSNDYIEMNLTDDQKDLNPLVHFECVGRLKGAPLYFGERRSLKSTISSLAMTKAQPLSRLMSIAVDGLFRRRDVSHHWPLSNGSQYKHLSRGSRVSILTGAQARRLIDERGLQSVKGAWHYSWDLERFFPQMYLYETRSSTYVFHESPIPYVSAPAPLFCDDPGLTRIIARKGRFFPYWFLKVETFDEFLDRRALVSTKSKSNFPSWKTYRRLMQENRVAIERLPLIPNREIFVEQFSKWKGSKFRFDGDQCLSFYLSVNPGVPVDWFYFYVLRNPQTAEGRGVLLTIEDGHSAAFLNLANEPGYGVIMIVETLRRIADLKYSSFNAGVSGSSGGYKNAIFLDTIETDASGFPPIIVPQAHKI